MAGVESPAAEFGWWPTGSTGSAASSTSAGSCAAHAEAAKEIYFQHADLCVRRAIDAPGRGVGLVDEAACGIALGDFELIIGCIEIALEDLGKHGLADVGNAEFEDDPGDFAAWELIAALRGHDRGFVDEAVVAGRHARRCAGSQASE